MNFSLKNTMTRAFAALFCLAALLSTSCEGLGSDVQNFAPQFFVQQEGGSAYVTLGSVRAYDGGVARTVLPEAASPESFSDLKLYLVTPTSGEKTKLAEAATLAELSSQLIEVSVGEKTFRLVAKRGGVNFSGDTTATLSTGSKTELSFALNAEAGAKGGLSVTINFEGQAACASYILFSDTDTVAHGDATFSKTAAGGSAVVNLSGLDADTYRLEIQFYGDEAKTISLNTYRELVRVSAGLTSRAANDINLTAMYKINYHNLPSGVVIEGGGTLPQNYSRKSGTITLPNIKTSGKYFVGYYTAANFNKDSKISQILGTSGRDVDLYPLFTDKLYVANDGSPTATGTQDDELDCIESAVNIIKVAADDKINWTVFIDGMLSGPQSIESGAGTSAITAASITLKGLQGPSAGVFQDGIDAGWDGTSVPTSVIGPALTIKVGMTVPITMKDLLVKGGYATNGGGIYLSKGYVTFESGMITTNKATTNGGGVFICNDGFATFEMKDGFVAGNHAGRSGGGVYIRATPDGSGSFVMSGGTVSGNSAAESGTGPGYGHGVYLMYPDSKNRVTPYFGMSGSAVVASDNDVYLAMYSGDEARITVDGALTGEAPVATITGVEEIAGAYENNKGIVDYVDGSLVKQYHNKFAVTSLGGNKFIIDENGNIVPDNGGSGGGGTSGNVVLYVKAGGNSYATGTESDPFGSISAAAATFSGSSGDANTDYVIKVIGEINDSVPNETCNIKSLTIEGATGSGTDSITGITSIYYDSSPLIFKNIKITGSTSGIEIGTCWDPPSNYYHVNVTFDEGTLITGNTTSNANYGGAMYIYKDSTVTIKEGCEISGNYNTDSTNAGIVVSNGGSLVMEGGTLENNCRPPYGIGYAVYAMSGSTFEMKGGTIKNNGIGVKIANGSTFKMSGSACVAYNNNVGSDYSEDMIDLESGAKIILDGDLQTTGTVPAGVIRPETYGETVQVLDQTTSGLIANNCGKFNVEPDTSSGYPGVKYRVDTTGYLKDYAISLYVKEDGTGDGSSADQAFGSIAQAAYYISQNTDASREFKIKIVETLSGAQILQGVDNTKAASITIEGANGLSNGVPQDCLDGQSSAQKTLTIKTDSDQLPVYIKNLKITGATQNGLYIGGTSFGGVSNLHTAVIIDEGALITGNGVDPNSSLDGGGIYVFRSSTLYVYGGEISYNTAARNGGGIYANGYVELIGGNITNNTASAGKGIYVDESYGSITMGYKAYVDYPNDIYLPTGKIITISSSLTAPINPVAYITPATYPAGNGTGETVIQIDANAIGINLGTECSKFGITTRANLPDGTKDAVDSSGRVYNYNTH